MRGARTLAGAHACYLIVTGLWPLFHRPSFERVTGPKRDFWLVRIVGGLVAASGVALALPVVRGRRSPEAQTVAAGSALVLAVADVWAGRNQSKMYFADLPLQVLLTPAWFVPWRASKA